MIYSSRGKRWPLLLFFVISLVILVIGTFDWIIFWNTPPGCTMYVWYHSKPQCSQELKASTTVFAIGVVATIFSATMFRGLFFKAATPRRASKERQHSQNHKPFVVPIKFTIKDLPIDKTEEQERALQVEAFSRIIAGLKGENPEKPDVFARANIALIYARYKDYIPREIAERYEKIKKAWE